MKLYNARTISIIMVLLAFLWSHPAGASEDCTPMTKHLPADMRHQIESLLASESAIDRAKGKQLLYSALPWTKKALLLSKEKNVLPLEDYVLEKNDLAALILAINLSALPDSPSPGGEEQEAQMGKIHNMAQTLTKATGGLTPPIEYFTVSKCRDWTSAVLQTLSEHKSLPDNQMQQLRTELEKLGNKASPEKE